MPDCCGFCGIDSVPDQQALRSARVAELLRQNGPPLETEKPALLATIADGPGKLSDLEKKIAEARQVLEGLLCERELVKVQLADAKMLLHPLRLLSDEILREIFSLCVHNWEDIRTSFGRLSAESLDPRRPPWTLTRVSHKWRDVALSSPRLWSTVIFDSCHYSKLNITKRICLFRLSTQLARSRECDLTVFIRSRPLSGLHHHPAFALLEASTYRWKSLYANMPPRSLAAFSGNTFPRLCDLIVKVKSGSPPAQRSMIVDTFESALSLRTFCAVWDADSCRIFRLPWSSLTSYTCADASSNNSWVVMERLTSVHRLSLSFRTSTASPHDPISMPEREDSSSGTISRVFDSLVLSSLTFLDIKFPKDRVVHFPKSAAPLIHLSKLGLDCDFLHDQENVTNFIEFLRTTTRIADLRLGAPTLPDSLLIGMTIVADQTNVLPSLRKLRFSPGLPSFNAVPFFRMLESRYKSDAAAGKVKKERKITQRPDQELRSKRVHKLSFDKAEEIMRWDDICDELKVVYE
ncbi:hypothetical protein IW261DRAFT_1518387 [Armillaria novae-zelandiae]|uniref:F-box domain-containing protein n=1 Tax=Armillaria novae-zelandiae TaxID=153914 RepID=A0AA39NMX4_9AGAR|nr:hypothetical protein IW261DRAFT_1518387 [Armillaria novae-zelandiae]